MKFYHGTKYNNLKKLLPANVTGVIRASESTRKVARDVLFVTPDKGYAGVYGRVYEVLPENVRPYADYLRSIGEERKANRVTRADHDIYVCDSAIVLKEV